DLDLLKQIDANAILPKDLKQNPGRGVIISFSFSTLDEKLSKQLEPGAPSPQKRLETLKLFCDNGFLCGVNAMPLLPYISDTEEGIDKIVAAAKQYGANYILIAGLTLFGNDERDSKQLVFRFLENNYPDLLEKYEKMYGSVYYSSWQYQQQLKKRADDLCKKYGIRNSI